MNTIIIFCIKIIFILTTVIFFSMVTPPLAAAEHTVQVYFFYGEGCPHCKKEKAFLDKVNLKHPQMTLKSYEVWYNFENATLFQKMANAYGKKLRGVPMTFIGHFEPVEGYLSDEITGKLIDEMIAFCVEKGCIDPADRHKDPVVLYEPVEAPAKSIHPEQQKMLDEQRKDSSLKPAEQIVQERKVANEGSPGKEGEGDSVTQSEIKGTEDQLSKLPSLPLIGEIDPTRVSLPVLTILIGGLDGFNPCAFFVLFLLLSILIYARSRKIMLLIGGIFVFFSGFIYFLFMAAWLNLFLVIGHFKAITVIAGIVAVIIAAINIKDFFAFHKGVSLMIPDEAKPKLYEKTRNILKQSSLPSMIVATVTLAIAANAYELLCTAGFPMVYTRALTMHKLTASQYYLYLALYNIVYIVPLASIVVFFSITLGARKLTEWQGQVLKLIAGLMMLCLGVVLVIKPDLLNNVIISAGLLLVALLVASTIIYFTKKKT